MLGQLGHFFQREMSNKTFLLLKFLDPNFLKKSLWKLQKFLKGL